MTSDVVDLQISNITSFIYYDMLVSKGILHPHSANQPDPGRNERVFQSIQENLDQENRS